ncbi:DUF3574 domain-containing protein [Streptomyces sp. TRM43335]|uniref:DUF3574 domain-containing protein n=1 Tax=Streptomyces taklimakanensis TaxID=2569853 RepID=A0A6G2BF34_9ACTN|nr:DUF3574 domain-containing protein [Streptomyces taklimakanensis]MTE20673.1 DUF3574 domain-containing protein [Streptomyces taklimakanensis]
MKPHTSRRVRLCVLLAALVCAAGASTAFTTALQGRDDRPAVAARAEEFEAGVSAHTRPYVRTQLFFGTGRHHGEPPITEEQFMDFLDEYVTPRFPDGLTLQEGYGQWRDKTGSVNGERSYELILLYPAKTAKAHDDDIEYLRDRYTEMYGLESVGRVDELVRADF